MFQINKISEQLAISPLVSVLHICNCKWGLHHYRGICSWWFDAVIKTSLPDKLCLPGACTLPLCASLSPTSQWGPVLSSVRVTCFIWQSLNPGTTLTISFPECQRCVKGQYSPQNSPVISSSHCHNCLLLYRYEDVQPPLTPFRMSWTLQRQK